MKNNSCSKCGRQIDKRGPLAIHEKACDGKQKNPSFKVKDVSLTLEDGSLECLSCNQIFETKNSFTSHYWLHHSEVGNEHLKKIKDRVDALHKSRVGKPSWNRGLTRETDERIMKSYLLVKQGRKEGTIKPSMLGKTLSNEHKEKLSHARSLAISNGAKGGFKTVGWYKHTRVDGEIVTLRGTWEVRVAEWLDKNSVVWTKDIFLKYKKDDLRKTYVPDFYIPSVDIVLEVKGFYSDRDKEKMLLLKEQHKQINFVMLFEKDIKNLDSSLEFLL